MATTEQICQDLIDGIESWQQPSGVTRVEVAQTDAQCLMVFLRTDQELSERMFSLPPFQYPLPLLLHSRLVLSAIADHVQGGELALSPSELMAGVHAGVSEGEAEGEVGHGYMHGTFVDTERGVWHVPQLNPQPASPLEKIAALLWRDALNALPDTGVTNLDVIHVPDRPHITPEEFRKITFLTSGYNFLLPKADLPIVEYSTAEIQSALASAQTIATYV